MHAHRRRPDVPDVPDVPEHTNARRALQTSPLHQGVCWQLSHLTAQPSKDGAV